jgi:hypothetical protein
MVLLSPNYLPVILLFCARQRFLINHLKTKGFCEQSRARIASEQGEKGDNREKQGANRGEQARKAIEANVGRPSVASPTLQPLPQA